MSVMSRASGLGSGRGDEEGAFAAAFRTARTAMVMTDPRQADNPIVFANDAFLDLTGYGPGEVVGRNCRFLQGPDTSPEDVGRIREAVAAGEGIDVEILNYRKNGAPFWNALAISPVRDEAGRLLYFLASQADVSERKQAETELRGARGALDQEVARRTRELLATVEERTALVREVDHRVKNSLQVITSLMLLKARRLQDRAAKVALQDMAERIGALSAVHRVLSAGEDANRFSIGDFIADLSGDLMSAADPERIELELAVEPVSVAAAKAAPIALLVNELMSNALRHAFPGERTGLLTVAVGRRDGEIHIRIEDNGIGMPQEQAPGESFGTILIDMLVRQLRAKIAWEDLAPGTRATVAIPFQPEDGPA